MKLHVLPVCFLIKVVQQGAVQFQVGFQVWFLDRNQKGYLNNSFRRL